MIIQICEKKRKEKQAGKPHGFCQWTSGSIGFEESRCWGPRLKRRISKTKVSPVFRRTWGTNALEIEVRSVESHYDLKETSSWKMITYSHPYNFYFKSSVGHSAW